MLLMPLVATFPVKSILFPHITRNSPGRSMCWHGHALHQTQGPAAGFCGCQPLAIQSWNCGRIPSEKNPKHIVLPHWAGSAAHSQHSLPDLLLRLLKEAGQAQCHGCLHLFLPAMQVLPLIGASVAITSIHYLLFLQTNVCNCTGTTLAI